MSAKPPSCQLDAAQHPAHLREEVGLREERQPGERLVRAQPREQRAQPRGVGSQRLLHRERRRDVRRHRLELVEHRRQARRGHPVERVKGGVAHLALLVRLQHQAHARVAGRAGALRGPVAEVEAHRDHLQLRERVGDEREALPVVDEAIVERARQELRGRTSCTSSGTSTETSLRPSVASPPSRLRHDRPVVPASSPPVPASLPASSSTSVGEHAVSSSARAAILYSSKHRT